MNPSTLPSWVDPALWPHPPRFHALPEGRLHYVDVGEGAPTLFSHGTPTWALEWRHAIAAQPGRRIAVDHLGFGLSDRPEDAGYRPEDHAARFAAFADALDLHDVTLVLHDFGGPIGLPWALANPDRLRRLVLVNTWAWSVQDDPTIRTGARILGSPLGRFLYGWFNLSLRVVAPYAWADRSRLTPHLHAQYLAPFPDRASRVRVLFALARSMLASSEFFASLEARLPALRDVDVALIWGMADPAFRPHHLDRWEGHFPDAQVSRIADAGHWPHEEAPEAFVAALRATASPPRRAALDRAAPG